MEQKISNMINNDKCSGAKMWNEFQEKLSHLLQASGEYDSDYNEIDLGGELVITSQLAKVMDQTHSMYYSIPSSAPHEHADVYLCLQMLNIKYNIRLCLQMSTYNVHLCLQMFTEEIKICSEPLEKFCSNTTVGLSWLSSSSLSTSSFLSSTSSYHHH